MKRTYRHRIILIVAVLAVLVIGNALSSEDSVASENKCGDDITWEVVEKELVINGTGPMYNYSMGSAPWYQMSVKTVTVCDGVSTIGSNAFYGMNIASLSIPPSVTSLGFDAIKNCGSLTRIFWDAANCSISNGSLTKLISAIDVTIEIGDHVQIIPDYFIEGCTNVTKVVFGNNYLGVGDSAFKDCTSTYFEGSMEGIHSFGDSSFENCTNLVMVTIGSLATEISSTAFKGCTSVTTLNFKANDISVIECPFLNMGDASKGMVIDINSSSVPNNIFMSFNKAATVNISKNVRNIGNNSFNSANLTIDMSGATSIRTIGSHAFSNATIQDIVIPQYATSIGDGAFSECKGVDTITYNAAKLTSISPNNDIFNNISYDDSLNIVLGTKVSSIPDYMFISIGASATIALPASLKTVGSSAFHNSNISIDMDDATALTSIGNHAFAGTEIGTIILPSELKILGDGAFESCRGVNLISYGTSKLNDLQAGNGFFSSIASSGLTVQISETITTIPSYLFESLDARSSVTLPSTILKIDDYAFYNSQTNVNTDACSSLTYIGDYALYGTRTTSLRIPESVTTLGIECFAGMSNLNTVAWNTTNFDNLDMMQIFKGSGSSFTLIFGSKVTSIPAHILEGVSGVGSVYFPNDIDTIGEYAFYNSNASLSLEGCESLKTIGDYALSRSSLYGLYLYPSIESCGPHAFDRCMNITNIYYGSKVVNNLIVSKEMMINTIGSKESISLSFGLDIKDIPEEFLKGVEKLTNVQFDGILSIGNGAFQDTGLVDVIIPASVTHIGDYSFAGTEKLTRITFESEDTTIGSNAFSIDSKRPLEIICYKKAVQNDYDWRGDNRTPTFEWNHVVGEYDGMMEVIFEILEPILGYELSNELIDFFIDNNALKGIESIDMGSVEANHALLIGIAILLTIILFVLLLRDKSDLVRRMESLIALIMLLLIAYSCVRRVWEYLDNQTVQYLLTALIIVAMIRPIVVSLKQVADRPDLGDSEETLERIYSLDWASFRHFLGAPFNVVDVSMTNINLRRDYIFEKVLMVVAIPFSLVYDFLMVIVHLPSYILSVPISWLCRSTRLITSKSICPKCDQVIGVPYYKCKGCDTVHKDLISGKYGFRVAVCKKCKAEMRKSLKGTETRIDYKAMCPKCGEWIYNKESDPFCIGFAGPPKSGRTTMALAMAAAVKDSRNVKSFEGMKVPSDGSVDETTESTVAVQVLMPSDRRKGANAPGIYYYDSKTDAYSKPNDEYREYGYYRHLDGIVLMINPLEIHEYRYSHDIFEPNVFSEPATTLAYLNGYCRYGELTKNKYITKPIAVVIPRCSLLGLDPIECSAYEGDEDENPIVRVLNQLDNSLVVNIRCLGKHRFFATELGSEKEVASMIIAWLLKENDRRI